MYDGVQKTASFIEARVRKHTPLTGDDSDSQAELRDKEASSAYEGWKTILNYGKGTDEKTIDEWKDELANLLIFIGLFSAVLTGFIVLTLPMIEENSTESSAKLLAQISQQLASLSVSPNFINSTIPALEPEALQPDDRILKLNILWIVSLSLSLNAAFFTISAQQWLRRIPLPSHLTSREAVRLRQLRYGGYLKWKIQEIISVLPVVVQVSVILFLAGLLLLLDHLNGTVAKVFIIVTSILWGIWVVMSILPIIWIDCPYQSPIIPVLLAGARLCMPPIGAIIVLPFSYFFYLLANPLQYLSRIGLPIFVVVVIFLKVATGYGVINPVPITHHPLYMKTMGNIVARLEIWGERLQLWAFYHALSFYASLSHSSSFWTHREYQTISAQASTLDSAALAGAPFFVPKDSLTSVQVECFEDIPPNMRPEFALACVRVRLELNNLVAFHFFRPRSTVSFTGHFKEFHGTLLSARNVLWSCLPKTWTNAGGVYVIGGEEDPYPYDHKIATLLCFLYRGSLRHSTRTSLHSVFMDDFARVLISLRNSRDNRKIIARATERLPISMLFGCCHRASTLDIEETRSAICWAVGFMADLIKDFTRPRHFIIETIREITQVRGVPLHEVPIYETALCACATPLLSLSHSTDPAGVRADAAIHDKMQVLLRGLDRFLTACFKDLAYLTQKVSYLDEGTHMLMTLSAITAIASSLVVLARLGYVAAHPECPSKSIATSLRQICATNVNGKLQAAEDTLVEFDEIWAEKWVYGFAS